MYIYFLVHFVPSVNILLYYLNKVYSQCRALARGGAWE